MNPLKIILGLVPFALFSLLAMVIPTGWAALAGLAAGVIVLVTDLRGGVKAIPLVAVVAMAAFSLLAFVGGPDVAWMLGAYGRGLAILVLAVYALATAHAAPFTAAYARETTPQQYWTSPRFVQTNRSISLAWGGTLVLMAAGHLVADALVVAGVSAPVIIAALNWGLPILAIVKTVGYTKRVAAGSDAPQPATA
jgi:hypothetical protein